MPANSMKYFFDQNSNLSTGQIVGYFDFSNTGISGLINIPSVSWTNSTTQLQLVQSGGFWGESGFATFNKQNYAILNLDNLSSASFLFAYRITGNSDNIFIANSDYISGFNFGININGYPYVEYYDIAAGPITICHSLKANKTGIINFSLNENNTVSLGVYNNETNNFSTVSVPFNNLQVKKSNAYFIGGNPHISNDRFLSAYIPEIFIYNPDYISSAIFQDEFASGIVYTVSPSITTGIVSGQTGILEGDIIVLKTCIVQNSGTLTEVLLDTGDGEYFASYTEFLDFNNEIYNEFVQQQYTGYYSGYQTGESSYLVCGQETTGVDFFEYESGYILEYSITTNNLTLNYPEYLYKYYNSISLIFNIDTGDTLSVYAFSGYTSKINFNNISYNNSDNSYGFGGDLGEDFSGLYYNGQLQTRSSGYNQIIKSGKIFYEPFEDYLITGNKILSNQYYGPLFENNSLIDFWPKSNTAIIGNINSGQTINNINFSNSLVFLNGQLLNSGTDYSGINTILFNIPSGHNILTIQPNILNFNKYILKNTSGSFFNMPFIFNSNMSMVWLNGQRLSLNDDYYEQLQVYSEKSILIQNTGVIIYSNN